MSKLKGKIGVVYSQLDKQSDKWIKNSMLHAYPCAKKNVKYIHTWSQQACSPIIVCGYKSCHQGADSTCYIHGGRQYTPSCTKLVFSEPLENK